MGGKERGSISFDVFIEWGMEALTVGGLLWTMERRGEGGFGICGWRAVERVRWGGAFCGGNLDWCGYSCCFVG